MDYRDPTEIANWEPVPDTRFGYRGLVERIIDGGESMAFRCDDEVERKSVFQAIRNQCDRNFRGRARVRRCAPYVIVEVM